MNSKVHKAKLISIHNRLAERTRQNFTATEDEGRSIHTYFALLKHIFQRNKVTIRKAKKSICQQKERTSNDKSCFSQAKSLKVQHLDTANLKKNWHKYQRINKCSPQQIIQKGINRQILFQKSDGLLATSFVFEENTNQKFIPIGKIARHREKESESQNAFLSKLEPNIELAFYPKELSERTRINNRSYRTQSAQLSNKTKNGNTKTRQKYRNENVKHLGGLYNKSEVFLEAHANLDPSPWQNA